MSFTDTVALERALISSLLSPMGLRKHIGEVKESYFSSDTRRFIFGIAEEVFRQSHGVLTDKVFDYEMKRLVDVKQQKHYETEWHLIKSSSSSEPPSYIIRKLKEARDGEELARNLNDIADLLTNGKIEEAKQQYRKHAFAIKSDDDIHPIVEITDIDHRIKLIQDKKDHPEKYMGIKTGFPTFDKMTGGLYKQELTLVAGITGLGKSTLVKQLQYNIMRLNHRKNVLHIANEESQIQVETKFDALITEMPYLDFKRARLTDDEVKIWKGKMDSLKNNKDIGRLFVKEVPAFSDVSHVIQAYRELEEQDIIIDVIIIDHLPHIVPVRPAYNENDEKGKAAGDCKQIAKDLNVAVVVPTQAATEVEALSKKGKRAGKLSVYGSKAQVHVANTYMIITLKGTVNDPSFKGDPNEKDVVWLWDVKKNRDGAAFSFTARHFVRFGKVEEFDEFASLSKKTEAEEFREAAEEAESISIESAVEDGDKEEIEENEEDDDLEVVAEYEKKIMAKHGVESEPQKSKPEELTEENEVEPPVKRPTWMTKYTKGFGRGK